MKKDLISKSMSVVAAASAFAFGGIALNAQATATWGGGSGFSIDSQAPEAWDGTAPRLAGDVGTMNSGSATVAGVGNWLGTLNVNSGAALDLKDGGNAGRWALIRLNGGRIGSSVRVNGITFGNATSVIELIGNNNVLFHDSADATGDQFQLDAALTGTGSITKTGKATVRLRSAGNTFSGDLRIQEGRVMLWEHSSVLTNTTVDMAGGSLGYFPGADGKVVLGGLKGTSLLHLNLTANRTQVATEFRVGRNNQSTAFSGNMIILTDRVGYSDQIAFVKEGTGTLTLSGNSTYPGNTVIEAGALIIDGQHNDSHIIVKNGGALGGDGIIRGNITFENGAGYEFDILKTLTIDKSDAIIDFGTLSVADIKGIVPSSLTTGDLYTLITGTAQYDYSDMSNIGIENAASIGNGLGAYFVTENGLQLAITAIPEASTVGWVGIVFFSALIYRKRRK